MKLLAIDTSGRIASAAVCDGGEVIAEKTLLTTLTHSQIILPMAKELLSEAGLDIASLDGAVCANGPGSYTGLRIGIAAVKGLAMGCPKLKCAGVSTLESLAYNCSAWRGRIVSVMAARSGVVYGGIYFSDGEGIKNIFPDRVCAERELADAVEEIVGSNGAVLVGDGCVQLKENYFSQKSEIKCAPAFLRTQRASSLCAAFEAFPERAADPNELNAAYLQQTRADKLKKYNGVDLK